MKYTTDEKFSTDFCSPGGKNCRYDTKEEAEKDIAHFRAALGFVDYRPDRGGSHTTVQSFASPTRHSPQDNHAEEDGEDGIIKTLLENLIRRVEVNARRYSVRSAALTRRMSWKFSSAPKLRTARFIRLRKFKATRLRFFSNLNKASLKMVSKIKIAVAQLEWHGWREKVISHIHKFIKGSCVWKLINAKIESANKISTHQLVLVQRKAQVVMQFMVMMNERAVGGESESGSEMKASEIVASVGKYNGCSANSVYNYYLEYKVHGARCATATAACIY
jgi:hypothetical protein